MGTWRYTCSPTLGRNHTNVPYATNHLDEKVTWKDTCSPTVERNHTIVLPRRDPSSADSAIGHSIKVDLSENISSCTLELSHTSVKYATNHLSVSITWYTTLESTAGKGLSSAENAVSPSTNVYISRHISSLTLEQSHSSVRSVRNQFRNRVTWKGTCTVSIAHPH